MSRKRRRRHYYEDRREMHYYGGNDATVINADTVNIQQTYYTQTNIQCTPRRKMKQHPRRVRDDEPEPKLLRYCQSGGLFDGEKLSRMSDGEVASESMKVVGYAGGKALDCFGNAISGVANMIGNVLGALFD